MRTPEEIRREKNEDLARRYKAGETLASVPAAATWWQPRGIIKKDMKEVERLYGKEENFVGGQTGQTGGTGATGAERRGEVVSLRPSLLVEEKEKE